MRLQTEYTDSKPVLTSASLVLVGGRQPSVSHLREALVRVGFLRLGRNDMGHNLWELKMQEKHIAQSMENYIFQLLTFSIEHYQKDLARLLCLAKTIKIRQAKTKDETRSLARRLVWSVGVYEKTQRQPGFIYVLEAGSYIKIGRSKRVDNRIKTIDLQMPFKVKPLIILPTLNDAEAEKFLHATYANRRMNGEWFQLNGRDLAKIGGLPAAVFDTIQVKMLLDGGCIEVTRMMQQQVKREQFLKDQKFYMSPEHQHYTAWSKLRGVI